MARALCMADGVRPDKLIGCPEAPRWRSYVTFAETAIRAQSIIAAGAAA